MTPPPVHVLYGGAHRFSAASPGKLAGLARDAMAKWGSNDVAFGALLGVTDEGLARLVAERVRHKLDTRPIEAMCIDFEDGFGRRSDQEEDVEAERTGSELAAARHGHVAPLFGMRVRADRARAARTLSIFLRAAARSGGVGDAFTVTLPKVQDPAEVATLAHTLTSLEEELGLPRIGVELMVETPRALVADGTLAAAQLVRASDRVVAVHLGAYDLTAELGVTGADQRLDHPICDVARVLLSLTLAGTGVRVADGATTTLPTPPKHADDEGARLVVERAWALHARNVRRAIDVGIWQGWDLHPAQLPARFGALYAHFLPRQDELLARWRAFRAEDERASRVGHAFDDAATARALDAFFARGTACGAFATDPRSA